MKNYKNIALFIIPLMVFCFVLSTFKTANSQIILVNLRVKIVEVERKKNRLQVRVHEKGNKNVQYVEIDDNTVFSKDNKVISYDEAWRLFKKDQIIRVRGGYTMSIHVKAKKIYF